MGRVIWKRQELNRDRRRYADRGEGNCDLCSYCKTVREDEIHIYTECQNTGDFWITAQQWFRGTFGENPSLVLKGPRLFGLENEPPDDLHNIFYRSARYCIYLGRKNCTPMAQGGNGMDSSLNRREPPDLPKPQEE